MKKPILPERTGERKMRKRNPRERIRYWMDSILSKGTVTMSVLLFVLMALVVVVIAVIAVHVSDEGSLAYQLWASFNHTLDAGTLAGNDTGNVPYIILMTISTLCGLFITSTLIGIIASGVESRLDDLHKGFSIVQEEKHTVIIGFNNNVYNLLRELIEANTNKKRACVVVLGDCAKEEMEEAISAVIPDTKTTKIICRSGRLHESYSLERCSVDSCRSVIINVNDDMETIKIILALSTHLKGRQLVCPKLSFVASMQNRANVAAAHIAGEGRVKLIYTKEAIARIISNTCRQHGLSQVLTEMFNFSGNEMYFESVPQLAGKSFGEAGLCFSNAVPMGIFSQGQARLNPPPDTVLKKEDMLVLLEADDGAYQFCAGKSADESAIIHGGRVSGQASDYLLVLGSNDKLEIILSEYDKYVSPGTRVVIVDENMGENRLGTYKNLELTVCAEPFSRELMCRFLADGANNVLLLNDSSQDPETSDSRSLLRLIQLRDIAERETFRFSITTEMYSVDNQRLASQARVDDFVIGENFASLLMAQISENPDILPLITDLLDESGSELYMKPMLSYVRAGVEVDSYTLAESAARKGEVCIGYRLSSRPGAELVINPCKEDRIVFSEGDHIIVLAEN